MAAGVRAHEGRFAWGMLGPALILLGIFLVVPFLLAIWLSFTDQRLVPNPNLPTRFIGFRNYLRVFADGAFWQAFGNILLFMVVIVPLQSAIALGVAILVNSKLPFRNVFRGVFFLPAVLTMVVVSVAWASLFQIDGVFNRLLQTLSFSALGPVDWLRNEATALPSIMLLSLWQGFGFQMVIYLAGLQSINPELYEAARVEGASKWGEFWNVTMPSLKNTHIFVVVTTTILASKLFAQVELLTQGGPQGATNTVVRYIYQSGFREGRVGFAAAVSVVFFLFVLAISILQRVLVKEDQEGRT
jgi:multiple sugar transport system permease protein